MTRTWGVDVGGACYLSRERLRRLLRDDGVRGTSRVNAVPEQDIIGGLAREWGDAGVMHADVTSVRPNASLSARGAGGEP